jgi:hypothetical protein
VESTYWTQTAAIPIPLHGWVAMDDNETPGVTPKRWHPVVAIVIGLHGEMQVCIAPRESKIRWLTNPTMRKESDA